MRQNKHIIILSLIAIALNSMGCRKFLESHSENNVSVAELFTDYEGARTAIIGCYNKMKTSAYYTKDFYAYPELTGGNINYAITKAPSLYHNYSFTNVSLSTYNDMYNFYTQAYSVIYSANNVLENVDNVTNAKVTQLNRIKADAYTIRAMAHFDLVRVFAQDYSNSPTANHRGIVIKIKNTDSIASFNTYSTVKQVYDQVLSDLDTAIALYAASVDIYPSGSSQTWLSANAANALKARVCLYKGDYTQAYNLSTTIIKSGKYPLLTTSNYDASWSKKNISSESIFELAFGAGTGGGYGDYFNFTIPQTLYAQFATSNDLIGNGVLFDPADVRGHNFLFKDTTIAGRTYSFSSKYFGTADSTNNIKVIRASELYLIAAESAVQSDPINGLSTAATYLNAIRTRANPNATYFTAASKQAMLDEIFNERRRELCFEGHLFFDIARMHRNLVRVDCSSNIKGFTYPNTLYACPIPTLY